MRAMPHTGRLPASRDRWHDGDLVALLQRGLGALEEPDVLLVDVDIDEAPDLPAVLHQPLLEARVLALEVQDYVVHGVARGLDLGRALGHAAKRRWDSNHNGHVVLLVPG